MTTQIADALDRARRRGLQKSITEWKSEDNLTPEDFAKAIGVHQDDLVMMNREGKIYAIHHPETLKIKYAGWQISAPKDRLVGALRPFYERHFDQFKVHFFMITENHDLGMTPVKYIEDKTKPMDVLIYLIVNYLAEA